MKELLQEIDAIINLIMMADEAKLGVVTICIIPQ